MSLTGVMSWDMGDMRYGSWVGSAGLRAFLSCCFGGCEAAWASWRGWSGAWCGWLEDRDGEAAKTARCFALLHTYYWWRRQYGGLKLQ